MQLLKNISINKIKKILLFFIEYFKILSSQKLLYKKNFYLYNIEKIFSNIIKKNITFFIECFKILFSKNYFIKKFLFI